MTASYPWTTFGKSDLVMCERLSRQVSDRRHDPGTAAQNDRDQFHFFAETHVLRDDEPDHADASRFPGYRSTIGSSNRAGSQCRHRRSGTWPSDRPDIIDTSLIAAITPAFAQADHIDGEATSRMTLTPQVDGSMTIKSENLKIGTTTNYKVIRQ